MAGSFLKEIKDRFGISDFVNKFLPKSQHTERCVAAGIVHLQKQQVEFI